MKFKAHLFALIILIVCTTFVIDNSRAVSSNEYEIVVRGGDEFIWQVTYLDEELLNKSTGLNKEDLGIMGKVGAKFRIVIDRVIEDDDYWYIVSDAWVFTAYEFESIPYAENTYITIPKNPRNLYYYYYSYYFYIYAYPFIPFPAAAYINKALEDRDGFTVRNSTFNVLTSSLAYSRPFYIEYYYQNSTGIMTHSKFVSMNSTVFYEFGLVSTISEFINKISGPEFPILIGITVICIIGIGYLLKKDIYKIKKFFLKTDKRTY